MKVLLLVTTPKPFFTQQVQVLENHGIDCTVEAVPGEWGPGPEQSRSPTDYLRYYPRALARAREDFDVVHVHYGLIGPVALAQPIRPVVLTLWGSDLMADNRVLRNISRSSARWADATVVPSETMECRLGSPCHRVPWGVDTDMFRPIEQERARDHLGWPQDETIALFPYSEDREVKDFPRARQVVERASPSVQLRTMEGIPYEQVPYHMNAADVVLVTSRRESGPMVVKEAAACNVPVVSTAVGWVPETLTGVTNSYVCESDEELVAGLESVIQSGERSDGQSTIAGQSLDASAENLIEVYQSVL